MGIAEKVIIPWDATSIVEKIVSNLGDNFYSLASVPEYLDSRKDVCILRTIINGEDSGYSEAYLLWKPDEEIKYEKLARIKGHIFTDRFTEDYGKVIIKLRLRDFDSGSYSNRKVVKSKKELGLRN